MRAALLVVIGIALVGCSDNTISKLDPGSFPATIYDNKPIKLSAVAMNKSGKPIPDVQITYQVNPSSIAEIANNGELRCLSSGDATILLNGGGQSSLANIKCRLVAKIEAPKQFSITMGREQADFQPRIVSEKGDVISDAVVVVKSADEKIVRVENGHLKPVQTGKTYVTYSSGVITTTMDIVVSKLLTEVSGPLFLADGGVKAITLMTKGSYDIEVQVSPQGAGRGEGVAISSTAASCNQPERAQHHFQCDVLETATITISNPTAFGMGAAMSGFVNIIQMPSN